MVSSKFCFRGYDDPPSALNALESKQPRTQLPSWSFAEFPYCRSINPTQDPSDTAEGATVEATTPAQPLSQAGHKSLQQPTDGTQLNLYQFTPLAFSLASTVAKSTEQNTTNVNESAAPAAKGTGPAKGLWWRTKRSKRTVTARKHSNRELCEVFYMLQRSLYVPLAPLHISLNAFLKLILTLLRRRKLETFGSRLQNKCHLCGRINVDSSDRLFYLSLKIRMRRYVHLLAYISEYIAVNTIEMLAVPVSLTQCLIYCVTCDRGVLTSQMCPKLNRPTATRGAF